MQHPRFYFFDNGVLNGLLSNFNASADRSGLLFETLFFNQLRNTLEAAKADYRLSTYRTSAGAEVDIILEIENSLIAIECKTGFFRQADLRGFESFQGFVGKRKFSKIVVTDSHSRRSLESGVDIFPWQTFLAEFSQKHLSFQSAIRH